MISCIGQVCVFSFFFVMESLYWLWGLYSEDDLVYNFHILFKRFLPSLLLTLFEVIFQYDEVTIVLNELFFTLPFINSV